MDKELDKWIAKKLKRRYRPLNCLALARIYSTFIYPKIYHYSYKKVNGASKCMIHAHGNRYFIEDDKLLRYKKDQSHDFNQTIDEFTKKLYSAIIVKLANG